MNSPNQFEVKFLKSVAGEAPKVLATLTLSADNEEHAIKKGMAIFGSQFEDVYCEATFMKSPHVNLSERVSEKPKIHPKKL